MDDASPGVGLVSQTGDTSVINQEYQLAGSNVFNYSQGELVPRGSGETSTILMVNSEHQFASAISMLVPSPDRLVGVADLRLCDGDQWKREVQVCFELFSTATASDKVAPEMQRNSLQINNCSFGYVRFTLRPEVGRNNFIILCLSLTDCLLSYFPFRTRLGLCQELMLMKHVNHRVGQLAAYLTIIMSSFC